MNSNPNFYATEDSEDSPAHIHQLLRHIHELGPSENHEVLKWTKMAQAGQDFALSPAYKASQAGKVPREYSACAIFLTSSSLTDVISQKLYPDNAQ